MKRKLKSENTDNGSVIVTPGKPKKPVYKKWWFWVIILCLIAVFGTQGSSGKADKNSAAKTKEVTSAEETSDRVSEEVTEEKNDDVSKEYKNALKSAGAYSKTMHMSKQAIYDQLTSEYGDQFSADAAQYAVDNLQADYNNNALKKAESYSDQMSMSKDAIYDQLTSEYGEKFTPEEAQYAIDHLQ